MADVKISGLPAASSAAGAMELEVNDAGSSKKVTVNQLQDKTIGTSNGLIARTGANATAARTITAGNGVAVSNGNGVSGNPTISADFASQAEAEAGTNSTKPMNALRTKQQIDALSGTSGANKLLKLDGTGKLPAVDGSQLTNLPGGGLGDGQTWQDVTASRTFGTSYQNTTGRTIVLTVGSATAGTSAKGHFVEISSDNSTWMLVQTGTSWGGSTIAPTTTIIPSGMYYRIQDVSSSANLRVMELR